MVAGTEVGAYRVLQRIGSGGMGEVWIAEHTVLGRRAAIKVLHAAFASQPEIVARFLNEARAATAISDPGVVQIFDFGNHQGNVYIAMELLEGEPLDKRLARLGTLAVGDALRITRQVASALESAHARNIVHRDLKPENIFLVRDLEVAGGERAKVLDFGIAKLGGDAAGVRTQTSALMGTPAYMSPEQCRGAGLVDRRSDIYSLGCVLFALIVGRPPFQAEGAGDLIAMHLREPAPAPSTFVPGVSRQVDALLARCLAKDPGARFGSGGELAAAIGALLTDPVAVTPAGGARPLSPAPRVAAGYTLRLDEHGSLPGDEPDRARGTTLSSAAAETLPPPPAASTRAPLVAALAGVLVAAGIVGLLVLRGGARRPAPTLPAARPVAAAAAPAPEPPPAPTIGRPAPPPGGAAPEPAPGSTAKPETSGGHAPRAASRPTAKRHDAAKRAAAGDDDDIPETR